MDNALRDVYLNGTPVANADGTLNFSGAAIDFRTGTQLQEPLPGFPAAENTIAVGAELKAAQHWTRLFANLQASAIRVTLGVEGLSKANTGNGDINGYRVEYAIDLSVDGAGYQEVLSSAFDGKTTQRYMRSHRIELPRARQGWSIRLRRITPNANSNTIADRTFIDSVTEVIDAKLRYPMSAVVGIKINASQFQSIPTRAYHVRGRIIRVPANYDPELRSYSGVWDGTFKLAWTNNPAWVFHDLISNDRYGLARACRPAGSTSGACTRSAATATRWSTTVSAARSRASPATSICSRPPTPTAWCRTSRPSSEAWRTGPMPRCSRRRTCRPIRSIPTRRPTWWTASSATWARPWAPAIRWRWCRGTTCPRWAGRRSSTLRTARASRVTASSRSRSRALAAPRAARRTALASGCC